MRLKLKLKLNSIHVDSLILPYLTLLQPSRLMLHVTKLTPLESEFSWGSLCNDLFMLMVMYLIPSSCDEVCFLVPKKYTAAYEIVGFVGAPQDQSWRCESAGNISTVLVAL